MKKLTQTAGMILAGTLAAVAPAMGFAEDPINCDTCNHYTEVESKLASISTNINAIKQVIVDAAGGAGNAYGTLISAYEESNNFEQAAKVIAEEKADEISRTFLSTSGQDADSNQSAVYGDLMANEDIGGYSNLSATSLFSSRTVGGNNFNLYDSNQEQAAEEYIRFLSGSQIPALRGDPSSDGGKKTMNIYHTIAAAHSMNAYALSTIYAGHAPINKPASLDEILDGDDISSGAIMDYIYRDTVLDNTWLTAIGTDGPVDLSRKTVYMLVGVFATLYRIEQNQRLQIGTQTAANSLQMIAIQAQADAVPEGLKDPAGEGSSYMDEITQ